MQRNWSEQEVKFIKEENKLIVGTCNLLQVNYRLGRNYGVFKLYRCEIIGL